MRVYLADYRESECIYIFLPVVLGIARRNRRTTPVTVKLKHNVVLRPICQKVRIQNIKAGTCETKKKRGRKREIGRKRETIMVMIFLD